MYDNILTKIRKKIFKLIKELVEVAVERKQKNTSTMPYHD
ncbi:hypothetical protein Gotur_023083 [Gossypium turneri]